MKMHVLFRFFSLFIIIMGASFASPKDDPGQSRTIEVKEVVDLTALNPGVSNPRSGSPNPLAIDRQGNFYFLDSSAHRIMKYDPQGRFIAQIGSIGQGKENLYKPWGVFIENERLVVLNENATAIKVFSLDGAYQSSFAIPDVWYCYSLFVKNDVIYLNVIQKTQPEDLEDVLIAVYTMTGELVRKMGPAVKCRLFYGYSSFNEILIGASNDRLYWAHVNTPRIGFGNLKRYEKSTITDLIPTRMPEFREHSELAKSRGDDTPETEKPRENNKMIYISYCYGFGVDGYNHIYYASLVLTDRKNPQKTHYAIRVIRGDGKIVETIILRYRGEIIMPRHLLIGPHDVRYGIGEIKGKTLFFKFS